MGDIFLLTFPFIERRYRRSGFPRIDRWHFSGIDAGITLEWRTVHNLEEAAASFASSAASISSQTS